MRIVYCFLISICFSIGVSGQKVYFIYLQTDNHVPFYVKLGDRVLSSSASGYIILSRLVDSAYNFSVGFPSVQSESRFRVPVSGKDRGFLIRRSEEGWSLFDLQTSSVIKSQKDPTGNMSYERRNDDFTALLSKAANDTTLLFVPVVMKQDVAIQKEEPQKGQEGVKTGLEAVKKDTVVEKPVQADVAEVKKTAEVQGEGIRGEQIGPDQQKHLDTVLTITGKQPERSPALDAPLVKSIEEVYRRSVVKKHAESSTSEGFGLVFYDQYDGGQDTIRLVIPNPRINFRQPDTDENESGMLEIRKDTSRQEQAAAPAVKNNPGNCKSVATENDFYKLRKAMAARTSDEGMVTEAKKYFRNKCFSTEQVKNLSALFLTSAGKYQFFDAAYLHITDPEHFAGLQSEIRDDYYIKRFKVLVSE